MVTEATIRFLLLEKSTLFSIQIFAPAMVIKPTHNDDHKDCCWNGTNHSAKFGDRPKKIANMPAITNTMVE
jgi:hypothetical protein